jgi:hypothetical protein
VGLPDQAGSILPIGPSAADGQASDVALKGKVIGQRVPSCSEIVRPNSLRCLRRHSNFSQMYCWQPEQKVKVWASQYAQVFGASLRRSKQCSQRNSASLGLKEPTIERILGCFCNQVNAEDAGISAAVCNGTK